MSIDVNFVVHYGFMIDGAKEVEKWDNNLWDEVVDADSYDAYHNLTIRDVYIGEWIRFGETLAYLSRYSKNPVVELKDTDLESIKRKWIKEWDETFPDAPKVYEGKEWKLSAFLYYT